MAKYEEWLEPDGLMLISAWARDGLTLVQIAKNVGVADSTFREWKARFPAIAAALKRSRELADIEVENALFKRAIGYEYTEKTVVTSSKGVSETIVTKRMAPDVGAQAFWLKNRRPDIWKERRYEIERDTTGDAGVIAIAQVADDGGE